MLRLMFLVILLAGGFYVGWPAFSGYQIHQGLQTEDVAVLEERIDFENVRQSMRGPILAQVQQQVSSGGGAALQALGLQADAIDMSKVESVVDGALNTTVTAPKLVEVYKSGQDFGAVLQTAVIEQVSRAGGLTALLKDGALKQSAPSGGGGNLLGGLLDNENARGVVSDVVGKLTKSGDLAKLLFPKRPSAAPSGASESFGLGNIKSVGFAGPLGLTMGVARDVDASAPDVTAEMRFEDLGWRVKKLTPDFLTR